MNINVCLCVCVCVHTCMRLVCACVCMHACMGVCVFHDFDLLKYYLQFGYWV